MTAIKTCGKHGELTRAQVRMNVYQGKLQPKCIQCENDRAKVYRAKNNEKLNEKDRQYWKENKVSIMEKRRLPEKKQIRANWYQQNKEIIAPYYREKQNEYRAELADTYVRRKIVNGNQFIRQNDIPETMVELSRAIIKSKRKVREIRLKQQMEKTNE